MSGRRVVTVRPGSPRAESSPVGPEPAPFVPWRFTTGDAPAIRRAGEGYAASPETIERTRAVVARMQARREARRSRLLPPDAA